MHHWSRFKSTLMASGVLTLVSACGDAGAANGSQGTAGSGMSNAGAPGVPAGGSAGAAPGQGQGGAASGASGARPTAGAPAYAGAGSEGGATSGAGGSASGGAAASGAGASGSGASGAGASGAGAGGAGAGGAGAVSCPTKILETGNSNRTLQAGGKSRSYVLHVPTAYKGTAPVPLIVDFHGHGGTGVGQASDSPYPKVVDADGVLMAFPTAIGDWNMGPCCADVDDLGFAKALVSEIEHVGCVDPKRVYATGFSMGGAMSHQLACRATDIFAAVAPAAFDLLEEHLATCKPTRPITVITFRGTQDNLALYDGGLSNLVRPIHFLGAINSMKKWAELNGCTGQAKDLGNNCQGFAAAQCPSGVESIVCSKTGGGHEQGNATLGWPVLKRHQLP